MPKYCLRTKNVRLVCDGCGMEATHMPLRVRGWWCSRCCPCCNPSGEAQQAAAGARGARARQHDRRQSAGLIPTLAHRSDAVLSTATSTDPIQPGPVASAVASLQALEPRAAQAKIAFGNAPYSGDPAAIRPMHPAVSCVRASGDGKPWYFDQEALESKDPGPNRQWGLP
jgi:hypothetical protein